MEISIAGVLFILLTFYLLLSRDRFEHLLYLCVFTELFVEIGYIAKVGDWVFQISRFVEDVFGLYCLANLKQIPFALKKSWLVLNICYILPLFFLLIFPSNTLVATSQVSWDAILFEKQSPVHPQISVGVISMTLRFMLYSCSILYIYNRLKYRDYKLLISRLSKICTFFIYFCLLEFVFKNFLGGNEMWGHIIEVLFGKTYDTVLAGRFRGNFYEICLFTKEVSHVAYLLVIMMVIVITNSKLHKKKLISKPIIISFFLLLVSTSFSVILFLSGFLFMLLIYRLVVIRPAMIKFEISFSILMIIVIPFLTAFFLNTESNSYVGHRLLNMIENIDSILLLDWSYGNVMGDVSIQARIISVIQTLIAFLSRPLFGLSLNSATCHGATAMLLVGIGVIGFYAWIKFYFYGCPMIKKLVIYKGAYHLGVFVYVFVNLFNSISIRPYYEITPLILSICLLFLFTKGKKNLNLFVAYILLVNYYTKYLSKRRNYLG